MRRWDNLPDWVESALHLLALFMCGVVTLGVGGVVLWALTLLPWPEGMW
jgi:hypothetical protein